MLPPGRFSYKPVPEQSNLEEKLLSSAARDEDEEGQEIKEPYSRRRHSCLWQIVQWGHITLTVLLLLLVVQGGLSLQTMTSRRPDFLYSPAQDAVRYVSKTFTSSMDYGKTKFQGRPSAKNNEAWSDLILRGLTRISADEAAPMHNKTMPIPDDPDHYIISLAVFHQLHCLNAIRFAVWNETMDVEKEAQHHETKISHLDHCVDLLRQALMCAADITPFVWARDPRDGKLHGITTTAHTCRDWDPIEQWAANRPIVTGFNVTKPIESDPLGWGGFQYVMDYGEITDWEAQRDDYEAWAHAKTHEQHLRGHVGYLDKTNYP